jgi:preprotein translocase subunit SecB
MCYNAARHFLLKLIESMIDESDMKENTQAKDEKAAAARFSLQKIYIKDLSFESPRPVELLLKPIDQSEVNFQIKVDNRKVEDGLYEVVLMATVTVTREKSALYLIEVKQAGLFVLNNFPEQELAVMLNTYCPGILYPYAREVVSSMAERGGFQQLLLKPMNFDSIYRQYVEKGLKGAAPVET